MQTTIAATTIMIRSAATGTKIAVYSEASLVVPTVEKTAMSVVNRDVFNEGKLITDVYILNVSLKLS